jgi:Family of unknown function (DUF6503)
MSTWSVIARPGLRAVLLSALCSPAGAQTSDRPAEATPTGTELLEKVIAHHDPNGVWNSYSGKVHLVTTSSDGKFGQEELEIRRAEDFYRATRIAGATRATKGVRKGQCIRDVDGNQNPGEARIKEFNLGCDSANFFKEHHTGHFGLPMALKASGMDLDKEVRSVDFLGGKALALAFTGHVGAVKHSYYLGRWTLYVDPVTHGLRGIRFQNPDFDGYCATTGELDVGGIRVPQVKTCYRGQDETFWLVDTFTYVAEARDK